MVVEVPRLAFLLLLLLLTLSVITLSESGSLMVYPDLQLDECNDTSGGEAAEALELAAPPDNLTLNSTLTQLLSSSTANHTVLVLQTPGCYMLTSFFLVDGTYNLSLVGSGPANEYLITCSTGVGLAFVDNIALQMKNITISGCGITGEHVESTVELIQDNVDVFFRIPRRLQYGLIIADCSDVVIENVAITNTQGLGLLAINVLGNSSFTEVEFLENCATLCSFESLGNLTSDQTIGGGMFLLYHDYKYPDAEDVKNAQLTMNRMTFNGNSYCSPSNSISAFYGQSATADTFGYVIASAAALGITLAQLSYSVDVVIMSSVFTNNTAIIGSGVHVGIFLGVDDSNVTFIECEFSRNGFADYSHIPLGLRSEGAGLLVFDNLYFPDETLKHICQTRESDYPVTVHIVNTVFSENRAYSCAALLVRSFQSIFVTQNHFQLTNSTFSNNQGSIGPVMCAMSSQASGLFPSFTFVLHDVTVVNNSVQSSSGGVSYNLIESSGQMVLVSVNLTVSGMSLIANNSGVAFLIVTSSVHFIGDVQFFNNSGIFGGAIRMFTQSYLVIHDNTKLSFINNQATLEGGAIFYIASSIYDSSPFNTGDCFLYFNYVDLLCNYSSCPDITSMNINVTFKGNKAVEGGTVYGSTLNSCPWYYILKESIFHNSTYSTALQLLSLIRTNFHFDPPLNAASVVSTKTVSLRFDNIANATEPISAYPGERISLQMSAYDGFGFRTSGGIASASDKPLSVNTRLGNSVYYFVHSSDSNGTTVPLDVSGREYQSANIELFSVDSTAQTILTVRTESCGLGFVYNRSSQMCNCIDALEDYGVICDARNETLVIPDNHWFGYLTDGDNEIPVYAPCFYDYCKPSSLKVPVSNLNFQCNFGYNRIGFACGECKNGTSAVFGTSACRKCSNYGLFWILGLAIAGIVMIIGISFLGVTITEGYLNGFIFYCNTLNYFFVYLSPTYPLDLIFSPAAWVNLGLGIESCFYDGMTTLTRVGLRFAFPLYLFVLMGITVILAKQSRKFAKLRFSASKTFATLILLSYFSILGTCIEIMVFTRYRGIYHNASYTRWNLDPSVTYGSGEHAILIAISLVLLLLYIFPFPLLFLFPKLLYTSRFTNKFMPIYDAFWNPFKPKFRFWLSVRALFRLVPFALALFGSYPTNVLGMVIFVPLVWFIHERIAPFLGYWQNAFDSFFLLNLIILFISNIYYERYRDDQLHHYSVEYKILVYTLVCSAYLAFLVILIIHVFIRFPNLKSRIQTKWNNIKRCKMLSKSSSYRPVNSDSVEELPGLIDDLPSAPHQVTFSEFREPLLDDYGTVAMDTYTKVVH